MEAAHALLYATLLAASVMPAMTMAQRPSAPAAPDGLRIRTVLEDGSPVFAGQLEWWPAGRPRNKQIVPCAEQRCALWALGTGALTARTVHVLVSRPHGPDPDCADWYSGALAVTRPTGAAEVPVRLTFNTTVCKHVARRADPGNVIMRSPQ